MNSRTHTVFTHSLAINITPHLIPSIGLLSYPWPNLSHYPGVRHE